MDQFPFIKIIQSLENARIAVREARENAALWVETKVSELINEGMDNFLSQYHSRLERDIKKEISYTGK